MNFLSILEPYIPPKGGCICLHRRRDVIFAEAILRLSGSGQRCGLNKSNVGQVTTGYLQRACCLRRYSVTIESNEIVLTGLSDFRLETAEFK